MVTETGNATHVCVLSLFYVIGQILGITDARNSQTAVLVSGVLSWRLGIAVNRI